MTTENVPIVGGELSERIGEEYDNRSEAVKDLLGVALSVDEERAAYEERIERYGDKEICDGITVDTAGNVYITDMSNNTIGVTRPSGEYEIIARDDEHFLWPDGFCCGPDGHIYFTVTQSSLSEVWRDVTL